MFYLNVKPQNQLLVLIIFLLGGFWGVLISYIFFGVIPFITIGSVFLLITVILGNLTNKVLERFDVYPFTPHQYAPENILDLEDHDIDKAQLEDQKDKASLVYGLAWSILFIVLALF